mmetsp:Transcript_35677/g.86080  ORF Transcript_35677/g.86080 Transcript_35677/m.86080 type:complete len:164 (+) Transcript_35677:139-630(+)|eukprot:CAMPEP_0181106052 /NCGR_PEP_ID=MMETSP1071-20121207/16321_1 /TAXON_ID=35127 /ORGANISM="Thalassiosira sp., Strain NH16" /LENGTH=163 /DNA_ID=CAMNT_0023189423 /DNA_START=74 /DNA_END=565 /DNA_ORIENTATION=+
MKFSAVLIAASVASASAFVPATNAPQSSTQLYVKTKGTIEPVKKAIKSLTAENFSATLSDIEPFLTKEAGVTIYTKSMRRIAAKAKGLGVAIPEGYAKDAKCTEKRRAKQDAYCQVKTEEAAAAAEEAAAAAAEEAAAAAAAAAAEAEAPAEETAEEETPAEE